MSASVSCRGVGKRYPAARAPGIKELLVGKHRPDVGLARRWALRDVSFEIAPGEGFGVVGPNGSGKSTLLGVLLGVLASDAGAVEMRGRVAGLLELGAGFHPELTGRQNLFLNGAIHGMRQAQLRALFDRIVDFSGVGSAIDMPLRTYSTGMVTRLGFAIVAHMDAEVLLVDEVLAVGDGAYRAKCFRYFEDFKTRGGTLVVVSHELGPLQEVCDRGVCLREGLVHSLGPMAEVAAQYGVLMAAAAAPAGGEGG